MYDGLLANERFTEEWEGYVAESWDISPNAREWTFKLRENVSFYQRGVPTEYSVTSADILHSININYFEPWQAGNSSRYADFFYPDEEHFEIINDHEFVWKLTKPNLIWGQHQTDERRGVISKDYFEKVGWDGYIADPIGAGPFTFLDFEINRGVSMERVVDHYRQTPLIHELEFIYVSEEATRYGHALHLRSGHLRDVPGPSRAGHLPRVQGGQQHHPERPLLHVHRRHV